MGSSGSRDNNDRQELYRGGWLGFLKITTAIITILSQLYIEQVRHRLLMLFNYSW